MVTMVISEVSRLKIFPRNWTLLAQTLSLLGAVCFQKSLKS